MNRTSLFVLLALVGTLASPLQAGWHHHRQYYPVYQAVPGYYVPTAGAQFQYPAAQYQYPAAQFQYPAAQPPAPQNATGDAAELLKRLIGDLVTKPIENGNGGNAGDGTSAGDATQVRKDLQDLRASLTKLDTRVSEIDSKVQAHDKQLVSIQDELKALKQNAKEMLALRKAVAEVKLQMTGKTPAQVKQVLESEDFKKIVQGMIKPDVKIEDALKALKDKIEALIK